MEKYLQIYRNNKLLGQYSIPIEHQSLEECKKDNSYGKIFAPDKYPCLMCLSRGWVHDKSEYDSNEGWSHAAKLKCPECEGTGEGSKSRFMEYYKDKNRRLKKEYDKFYSHIDDLKRALSKLSDEEIELVRGMTHCSIPNWINDMNYTKVDV